MSSIGRLSHYLLCFADGDLDRGGGYPGVTPHYCPDDLADLHHVELTKQSAWIKGPETATEDAGEDLT